MRILSVMNNVPFPPKTGSAILASNVLTRLVSSGHQVRLLTLNPARTGDDPMPEGTSGILCEVCRVPGASGWRRRLKSLLGLFVGVPIEVAAFQSREMRTRIGELWNTGEFDVIVVWDLGAIQHIPKQLRLQTVANIENPPSVRVDRLLELSGLTPSQRARAYIERATLGRYERKVLPDIGRVLLLSEDDAQAMRDRTGLPNIGAMPYGVNLPDRSEILDEEQRDKNSIVVTGNMFHLPNVNGVVTFLSQVFPLVLARNNAAKLTIVGADPAQSIRAAARPFGSSVTITGRVPDVARYIRSATVSVCPVQLRIGVQTKVLEAFAWGTPVVARAEANSGIEAEHGKHLLLATDHEQMACQIVSLLDGERWKILSEASRTFAESHFTWDQAARALLDQIERRRA